MTGFNSKRQASLDHIGYQGRETRPDELAQPNPWKDAIDNALIWWHMGTVESFPTAKAALDALIDWHVRVALDPEVSSDAQALIDRGAAQAGPEPVAWISEYGVQELTFDNPALGSLEWEVKRNHERGHDVPLYLHPPAQPAVAEPLTDKQMDQIMYDCGLSLTARDIARAIEQAHGIGIKGSAA